MRGRLQPERIALLFGTLAALLLGIGLWTGRVDCPVSTSIHLETGFTVTRHFSVRSDAAYRIQVRYQRSIPFEQLKKLLQNRNFIEVTLIENGNTVSLHHFVRSESWPSAGSIQEFGNVDLIEKSTDSGSLGFSKNWISQDIAIFTGERGKRYAVTCSVVRPAAELDATDPTFLIETDPLEMKGKYLAAGLLVITGVVSAVIALAGVASAVIALVAGKRAKGVR